MIWFAVMVLTLCLWGSLGEMYYERDAPRKTAKFLLIAVILLVLSASVFAQGTYIGNSATQASKSVSPGQSAPVYTVPYAKVYLCAQTQVSCNALNMLPLYSDMALTVPLAQPVIADALGYYGGYISVGQYKQSIYSQSGQLLKTTPFTALGASTGNITPTSVTTPLVTSPTINGVQYADSFAGADIQAKVAAAFAASAGTSGNPAPSAVVYLKPNSVYSFSHSIEIPNQTSAPFITTPILDCNGSLLLYTGNDANPAILVHGENVGDSILSGQLRNCAVSRADVNGPVIVNNDRIGWLMFNVAMYGGLDSYYVNLNNTDGGPSYVEQSYFDNVSFMNASRDGIRVHNGTGGNGGYQYNGGKKMRFQFNGDGHSEIHFETGINAFNGSYQTQVNTGGSGITYVIKADAGAVVLSSAIEFNGEGSTALKIGGGGSVDLSCSDIARMNLQFDSNANCHGPDSQAGTGAGAFGYLIGNISGTRENSLGFPSRNSYTYDNGTAFVRFEGSNGGTETNNGMTEWLLCATGTGAGQPDQAYNSTSCKNSVFEQGGLWGFGPGFGRDTSGASPLTMDHVINASGSGITSTHYDSNGTVGVSCPTGINATTYRSVNGITTHC